MPGSLNVSLANVGLAALIFTSGIGLSFGLAVAVLIRLPPNHFQGDTPPSLFFAHRPAWQRTAAHIGKNILGVLLIVLGVILSIPGVPGQGVLTILIGMTLVDFPGKRKLEQRIMRIPTVLRGANKIRTRFEKEPFILDEPVSV